MQKLAYVFADGKTWQFPLEPFINGSIKLVDGRAMSSVVPYWSAEGEPSPVPGGKVVEGDPDKIRMYWMVTVDRPEMVVL